MYYLLHGDVLIPGPFEDANVSTDKTICTGLLSVRLYLGSFWNVSKIVSYCICLARPIPLILFFMSFYIFSKVKKFFKGWLHCTLNSSFFYADVGILYICHLYNISQHNLVYTHSIFPLFRYPILLWNIVYFKWHVRQTGRSGLAPQVCGHNERNELQVEALHSWSWNSGQKLGNDQMDKIVTKSS